MWISASSDETPARTAAITRDNRQKKAPIDQVGFGSENASEWTVATRNNWTKQTNQWPPYTLPLLRLILREKDQSVATWDRLESADTGKITIAVGLG
nr:hypothetical protein [Pseudomonas sp. BIGb0427]